MNTPVAVSVVVAAFNAEKTLSDTLSSLLAQVHPSWEAIVVDDGSTDGTGSIAHAFAARDARIRVVSRPNGGESAARNTGIEETRSDWLLFLDSDDWIAPAHLERLTAALTSEPALDAVHCGSVRVALDGTEVSDNYRPPSGDLFSTLARRAAFPVHACLVRKRLVDEVGRFDTSLRKSADWDLWQRVARTGARFGAVQEVLAFYRMQPQSSSLDAVRLFEDGLCVLARGHSADPRVEHPHPSHAQGEPAEQAVSQRFYLLGWCAGLMIGRDTDPAPLLDLVRESRCQDLDATAIARCIFEAATLPACQTAEAWEALWPAVRARVEAFLPALEAHSQTPGLAGSALVALKKMILRSSTAWGPAIRDLEDRLDEARRALAALEARREAEVATLGADLEGWRHTADDYKASLSDTQASLIETRAALAESQASLSDSRASLAESQSSLSDIRATLAESQVSLSETRASLAENQASLSETRASLAENQASLSETRASLAESQASLSDTRASLADTQASLSNTRTSLADAQASLAELEAQLWVRLGRRVRTLKPAGDRFHSRGQ